MMHKVIHVFSVELSIVELLNLSFKLLRPSHLIGMHKTP